MTIKDIVEGRTTCSDCGKFHYFCDCDDLAGVTKKEWKDINKALEALETKIQELIISIEG